VSFRPTLTNATIGGSGDTTVVYECGARLKTPSADTVEIQEIGRGAITALSR
jgi:hypothetical protein